MLHIYICIYDLDPICPLNIQFNCPRLCQECEPLSVLLSDPVQKRLERWRDTFDGYRWKEKQDWSDSLRFAFHSCILLLSKCNQQSLKEMNH